MIYTKEQFAALLNGRQYQSEINRDEELIARKSGLLVVFGASNDLVEFRGVLQDEVGAYKSTAIQLSPTCEVIDHSNICDYDGLILRGWTPPKSVCEINAEWCPENFEGSWRIWAFSEHVSNIYSTFNIMEDDQLYCQGIVIDWNKIMENKS